jgi:hypothetical protein
MTASGPSKVVVLDPDARACRQVQLGFEREGIETVAPAIPADLGKLQLGLMNGDAPGLALVGGNDASLVRRVRELLVANNADVPIVFTGRAKREDLLAAGADAILVHPAYLRDVVTIARILRGVPTEHREHLVGSLVETTGVYTLVRALCTLGRSAVLTLIRGLRRGEIRFYRGEVTSAQVGLIHGQAAFHQLLLWTDARFDFAYEDIVRRAQIPMTAEELFKDAERFLEGVRESAELLSPSMVLEPDAQRVHGLGKQIPTEVHGVLRMFDGHRVLADILEDSPYRVFETLRVAQKAMEAGLLRPVAEQRPKTSWRAVLAIEEWLVGSETHEAVVERTSVIDSGPIARQSKPKFKKNKRKRDRTPSGGPVKPAELKPNEIDWGALVPRTIGAEVGPLSGVVPATWTHGEIDIATRDKSREKLEALMDTGKRDRIFPTEVGLEPSVVIRSEDTDEWEKIEWEAKAKADAAEAAKAEVEAKTTAFAKADADTEPVVGEATAKADAVAVAKGQADAKARADADAAAKADADAAKARADADAAKAKADADAAKARADADAAAKAKADADAAKARADAEAAAKAKADADAAAKAKADADKAKSDAAAKRKEAAGDRAAASMIATPITSAADDRGSTRVIVAEAITVAETSTATVVVADQMTVVGAADIATVTATPHVSVRESASESSDGAPRSRITTVETAPLARDRAPEHDGPPVKQTTGEISQAAKQAPEVTQGPSILIDPEPDPRVSDSLVSDLAAAHAAIAAATAKAASVPSKGDASSSSKEMLISEVRKDAVEFTHEEEAFFNANTHHTNAVPKFESFDDLDEGYEPPKFWDRVFGRKKKPK